MKENKNVIPLTDEEIEEKLKNYHSSNFPNTRNYIINKLKENPKWKGNRGIVHRQDIINSYYKSREENKKTIYNYDFSNLPEVVNNRLEKFVLFINEEDYLGNIIGEWQTSFFFLITQLKDNRKLLGKTKHFLNKNKITSNFIIKSKEKFGEDIYDYSEINYINRSTPIKIKCKLCGKYFYQRPSDHINSVGKGCPDCSSKSYPKKSTDKFIQELKDIFGEDCFDFSKTIYKGSDIPVLLINTKTGELYSRTPESLLSGRDPRCNGRSQGEFIISEWLLKYNIYYLPHYYVKDIKGRNEGLGIKNYGVYIDFFVKDDIWIEYNGPQHYIFNTMKGNWGGKGDCVDKFLRQVARDIKVREYCKINNIRLIEIPYLYYTRDQISQLLEDLIINNKPININQPKYVFPNGYSIVDVYKLIEEEGGMSYEG